MDTLIVETQGLRIAVEGCGHGTLHSIYASIQDTCERQGWDGVDLLIIGGDFQSVRNAYDLNVVSMPAKYREIGDFHEYYSGARDAPYLTIFIGGNHEASNYLWELYYGGWVAPNIYYMGAANVVRLGPLRIAGLSGIWKGYNYKKQHHERLPYNQDDIKSIYHVRELDTRKLLQIRTQVDIGLSHDWPRGIEWKGDWKTLFRKKSHFEQDARDGTLGSVAAKLILDRLRPAYWFSAHMHIKYSAIWNFEDSPDVSAKAQAKETLPKNNEEIDLDMNDDTPAIPQMTPKNDAEIDLDLDDEDDSTTPAQPPTTQASNGDISKPNSQTSASPSEVPQDIRSLLPAAFSRPANGGAHPQPETLPPPADIKNKTTRFLALDKCLPNRHFLQLMEVEPLKPAPFTRPLRLSYDKEWLAITRVFAADLALGNPEARIPFDQGDAHYRPLIEKEEAWVEENIVKSEKMLVPEDFHITATPYDPLVGEKVDGQPLEYNNAHTQGFCDLLQIPNPFHAGTEESRQRALNGPRPDSHRDGFRGGRGGSGFGRGRGGRGGNRGGGPWRGGGRGGGRGRGGRGWS
ncbi:lariat debranching enzyme [Mytilinidion resinicola]|uniref:Lariat debranching enzyme n=1 Tax=Mytilinidion resinicola TaxID=574789 RepID=A0A6A6YAQ3_9PEZI|nr:lariat debranching enzyme [Mytilinidion resinicola]KAF2804917.1 lariat debranching enzyme [Mytilinidion resinicola]